MSHPLRTRCALVVFSSLAFALPALTAQVAPATPPASAAATPRSKPVVTSTVKEDEPIVLSPFVIEANDGEDTYLAQTTLAGSRVRTDIKDIASALSVVTKKFMDDIGATSNLGLLTYTTNTEVGGLGGNFGGLGNGGALSETGALVNPNANTRVRGLDVADTTRDYFLSNVPWDGYNIDRIEIQRGANSILFGVGSPAGIINTTLSTASYRNAGKVEFRFGEYGSVRGVVDLNYALLPNELALRVIGLDDSKKFQQDPAFNHDRRIYGALRYDPAFLAKGSAHTTLTVNFEHGEINSNNPRMLPPIDALTPWFSPTLNKLTVDPGTAGLAGGVANSASANLNPWLYSTFRGYQFQMDPTFNYNYNSAAPASAGQAARVAVYNGISRTGAIDGSIAGLPFFRPIGIANYNLYASSTNLGPIANTWTNILPGGSKGIYKDKSLTDPTVFDFFNKLIDGPNKREWQDWNSANVTLVQSFFNNRLALQAALDKSKYDTGQLTLVNGGLYRLSVDINTMNVDGTPNANLGRPYIGGNGSTAGNNMGTTERTAKRLTLTGELQGEDFFGKSKIADVIGRQVFTGLVTDDTVRTTSKTFLSFAMGPEYSQAIGTATAPQLGLTAGDRQVDWLAYLGTSLSAATTAAGANINGLQVPITPATTAIRYFDSHWAKSTTPGDPNYVDPNAVYVYTLPGTTNAVTSTQSENPANYVGWRTQSFPVLSVANGDINQLYNGGAKQKTSITSKAVTWQGFWFDKVLVTTFGYRRDTVKLAAATAPKDPVTGVAYVDAYSTGDYNYTQDSSSRATSVVLHLPERFASKLPGHSGVRLFFNDSNNTSAVATRVDIQGHSLPPPTGKTKDYGFVVTAFDERLALRVNWYKTSVKNATLSGPLGSAGFVLANTYMYGAGGAIGAKMGLAGLLPGNGLLWDWSANDNGTPLGAARPLTATQDPTGKGALTDAQELKAADSFIAQMPSQEFMSGYLGNLFNVAAIKAGDWDNAAVGWNPRTQLTNVLTFAYGGSFKGVTPVGTVDNESKGVEFELTGQIRPNWNVSINASHTQSSRNNLGATLTEFVTKTKEIMDSDAGLIRLFHFGGNPIRTNFYQNVWYPYQFTLAQSGTSAAEVVPWRVNAVTNYQVTRGPLKGTNIGLGYRWEDKRILGYGISKDSANQWNLDVNQPLYGPTQQAFDAWIGYTGKLTKRVGYQIQLNVSSIGQDAKLVPLTLQPDGSPGSYRIQQGMTWQVRNTLTF